MFTQIWVFSPRFNGGYPFTSASVLGLCAAQSTSTISQTPKCYVWSHMPWLYGCLLFLFPSSSGRVLSVDCSHSETCSAHTQSESLLCSGHIHCTAMHANQEKDSMADWSGPHWNTSKKKKKSTLSTSILTRSLLRALFPVPVWGIFFTPDLYIHISEDFCNYC